MSDHHTSQHSYANFADTDTRDYHLEQPLQEICFNKKLPNVFGMADDILVVGYESDGKDHDKMLQKVLQVCRQVNFKLNKDKSHFRCTTVPCFGEVISKHGVRPDL